MYLFMPLCYRFSAVCGKMEPKSDDAVHRVTCTHLLKRKTRNAHRSMRRWRDASGSTHFARSCKSAYRLTLKSALTAFASISTRTTAGGAQPPATSWSGSGNVACW